MVFNASVRWRTILAAALAVSSAWGVAQDAAGFDRTASCVAAMKTRAALFSERYRAGDDTVKAELTSLTEAGYAFIGAAYEAGLRKADADRLLTAAEEAQKNMPAAALENLTTACHAEGAKLLAQANVAERVVVKAAARARINRIRNP